MPAMPGLVLVVAWLAAFELALCGALGWYRAGEQRELWLQAGLLLLLPAAALFRKKAAPAASEQRPVRGGGLIDRAPAWLLAAVVANCALTATAWREAQTRGLPPAIHDEYSYLLQAQTFAAGWLWFPSHDVLPELFDQVHVLNEGRFASRYFPGTALWLAPFVAAGAPHAAYAVAAALVAALVFATGLALGGRAVGFTAGLLVAVSPAMVVFGEMLLSHHPTLVGLMLFAWGVSRLHNGARLRDAALAGAGLGFGLLCRPLTAAAFALPVAVWLSGRLLGGVWRADWPAARRAAALSAIMGGPVAASLLVMALYNQQITGSAWKLPYEQYNDVYTPSHRYGFNNAQRGAAEECPKRLEQYDRWAFNLTLEGALANLQTRLLRGWQHMLGIAPLAMAGVAGWLLWPWLAAPWRMLLCMIVSLHAAYFPYWFSGILGFHYVFESGPIWALLVAGAGSGLARSARLNGRFLLTWGWQALVWGTLLCAYAPVRPWGQNLVDDASSGFRRMRARHAEFRALLEDRVTQRPALVLVEQPPPNIHIDFVVNHPALQGDLLVGRHDPSRRTLEEITAAFPGRAVYLFREQGWSIEQVGLKAR
jgi:hypothetical protein